jgi:hypothetical protein
MHWEIEHARRIASGMAHFGALTAQIQSFSGNGGESRRQTKFRNYREGESLGLTTAAITALATVHVKNVSAIPA